MNDQEEKAFYSPGEVAEMLHVSVDQLRQMRWQGRIKGTRIGNSTVYTLKQIQAADLKPRTRGRKKGKKNENGGEGTSFSSVMLIENRAQPQLLAGAA